MRLLPRTIGVVAICVLIGAFAGCGSPDSSDTPPLADTSWQLVDFLSMDDAIGRVRPDDASRYTMTLNADGSASLQIDCNQANGTWSAEPSDDPSNGSFRFGPLAVTTAHCPASDPNLRLATHAEYIRSYLLKDGRLHLSLMADGGIYTWEPAP